jgi:hypothetical protein
VDLIFVSIVSEFVFVLLITNIDGTSDADDTKNGEDGQYNEQHANYMQADLSF